MFDEYVKNLINLLPDLPKLDHNTCRRALSKAYFYIISSSINVDQDNMIYQELEEIKSTLRSMVDALESVAVFDRLNGLNISPEVENACAFVAGESLSLLTKLPHSSEELLLIHDPLFIETNYIVIESALLYMIGDYDINAVSVVKHLSIPSIDIEDRSITGALRANSTYLLKRLVALCSGDVREVEGSVPFTGTKKVPTRYEYLIYEIRIRFYEKIANAVDFYIKWLGGVDERGIGKAIQYLQRARDATRASGYEADTIFADIYHLCSLLLVVIDRTSVRSVVHRVPQPTIGDEAILKSFPIYLKERARGNKDSVGRPFLWPSALEFVVDCLPGPNKDVVISMPTGSGKSFIAELSIAHALSRGWVLYLAPTNALAHQIRRDLKKALRAFKDVDILTFVGGEEYTTLSEEQIEQNGKHYVAVMTPEKCSLAMRLYKDYFTTCVLCIFDECHLLNDHRRGTTADIIIAQLITYSPNIRFVLMSAMISNSNDLSEWLRVAHDGQCVPKPLKWRPSRTIRGFIFLNKEDYNVEFQKAKDSLIALPARRVNINFDIPLALIVGLSGPWTLDGPPDYCVTSLPLEYTAKASRNRDGSVNSKFEGWKNTSSRILSELFARTGLPVINFILTSRHHAFSCANKVQGEFPGCIGEEGSFPPIVDAWLSIADAELGVNTLLRELLRRGIAVHTSSMLQPEQAASEWMFSNGKALLMFATGTLAQGLNLPAIAVVIAGTSMGDPRDTDSIDGVSRVNAMILNGFGRAGRPGFSNQGIAVLVSDKPYAAPISEQLNPTGVLAKFGVLAEPDATVEVHSPIEKFIDNIITDQLDTQTATIPELALTSLLAEIDEESGNILGRTLAAYHKRHLFTPHIKDQIQIQISTIKETFLKQPDVPHWMNKAAMKAGVDLFRAWRIWSAYEQRGLVSIEGGVSYSVIDWLDVFFQVMSLLPPKRVLPYLADDGTKTQTILKSLRDRVVMQREVDDIPWDMPEDWLILWQELKRLVLLYMQGESYAVIAQNYLGVSIEQINNKRSKGDNHIPTVFGFLRKIVEQLAIDAGCFLAIQELAVYGEENTSLIPEQLQSLPLCIKNGCNSIEVLSWYRFAFRQRICAHNLEKAFPVPKNLASDADRANWVRNMRLIWLFSDYDIKENPLLNYARIIILNGGYF
ncbi:DEAD/DEAH box helicase [Pelotomaculum terephthalicicum JT]|uniref:DEAD/DEAH box helicase n=1 Tax=Pelotomaculum terephthalicicum TaxID=206393 RepID=UPI001F04C401|nr:DEAD/DEAH box helicase [Pelotomaculum terephthalicicum]MCG9969916.1 DEAD/DEAH box helicase [Pelotomaculum terephthalicicum JT]